MLWSALLPGTPSARPRTDGAEVAGGEAAAAKAHAEALAGVATWCLQFTPRVALVDAAASSPAIVMEVESSLRLFGGKRRLVERVRAEALELGVRQLSWAPTSLCAVALARAGRSNGFARPLEALLDELPIAVLEPVWRHQATLLRLGCQTLGQVRALPRGGLGRRFDKELLAALDQAYGLLPEVHVWALLPDVFQMRLELMARIELAPALLFAARRLLLQMTGWLAARHAGVTAYTLGWQHDSMRSRSVGQGGSLTIRTARPTRDIEHLCRLLAEHLAHVELEAPVGALELIADDVQPLDEISDSLFPEPRSAGETLALVLERIAARLGPARVLRPVLLEDYRPEWMCHWQPAATKPARALARAVDIAQPTFVFPEPLRLAMRGPRPMYQGVLHLLAGPHRIEGGWWDRTTDGTGMQTTRHAARDYWVALSEHAGVLWIFQTRLADEAAWFLHGTFA